MTISIDNKYRNLTPSRELIAKV